MIFIGMNLKSHIYNSNIKEFLFSVKLNLLIVQMNLIFHLYKNQYAVSSVTEKQQEVACFCLLSLNRRSLTEERSFYTKDHIGLRTHGKMKKLS